MDFSYREKSVWVSLIALLVAFGWYFYTYAPALIAGGLDFGDMLGAMIGLVILIVLLEIVLHVLLGIDAARRADPEPEGDERDALIDARSDRLPCFVLSAGTITAMFCAALQTPMITAHVLLFSLVLAETVKLSVQLFYYRRGF